MATSTLTLQAATAANFDTGWTQTVGNTWTSTSLVLTVTGAGSIQITVSLRDDDSSGEVYKQVVPWSASGTLTIPLPTPLYGQIRVKGDVVAAGGTVAVAISGDLGAVTTSDGTTHFPGAVAAPEFARGLRGMRSVLAVGDSITSIIGTGLSWAEQAIILSKGRICLAKNAGFSGSTIQDWIANWTTYVGVISVPVSEVWVQLGTNNQPLESASVACARMPDLIALIRSKFPQADICLFGIPPHDTSTTFAADFNSLLRGIAQDRGCKYRYCWGGVVDPATGLLATAYKGSTVHPNLAAHKLAASELIVEEFGALPTKNISLDMVADSTNPARLNGAIVPAKDSMNFGTPGAGTGFQWVTNASLTATITANTAPAVGNSQTFAGAPLPANSNNPYTKSYAINPTHNYLVTFRFAHSNTTNSVPQIILNFDSGTDGFLFSSGGKWVVDGFAIDGVYAKVINSADIPAVATTLRLDCNLNKANTSIAATGENTFSNIQIYDLGAA